MRLSRACIVVTSGAIAPVKHRLILPSILPYHQWLGGRNREGEKSSNFGRTDIEDTQLDSKERDSDREPGMAIGDLENSEEGIYAGGSVLAEKVEIIAVNSIALIR